MIGWMVSIFYACKYTRFSVFRISRFFLINRKRVKKFHTFISYILFFGIRVLSWNDEYVYFIKAKSLILFSLHFFCVILTSLKIYSRNKSERDIFWWQAAFVLWGFWNYHKLYLSKKKLSVYCLFCNVKMCQNLGRKTSISIQEPPELSGDNGNVSH